MGYKGDSRVTIYPYDFIIATYSLHHLTDDEKIQFIQLLKTLLKEGGCILIGDVAR